MLEPSNDYAWGYSLFFGKLMDYAITKSGRFDKLSPVATRYQKIGRPLIGFTIQISDLLVV